MTSRMEVEKRLTEVSKEVSKPLENMFYNCINVKANDFS